MRTYRSLAVVALASVALVTAVRSGHELPIYPSYYPHEIELAALTPDQAGERLPSGKIQAYVGGVPRFAAAPQDTIESIATLGSLVVVRVNPSAPRDGDRAGPCAMLDRVLRDMAGRNAGRDDGFVFHPYPVTPFHGDYLHHADLADAARARVTEPDAGAAESGTALRVRAGSELARRLVPPAWHADGPDWDVEVTESDVARLVAAEGYATNGWLGPDWLRSGWFHAELVLGPAAGDAAAGQETERLPGRLQTSGRGDAIERINLERSLVETLGRGCGARVAGYTTRREYYSTLFTAGIENIAFDALSGLNAPMFVRTVKLKDFPWNGWLALGVAGAPAAAWNPIAGFDDEFGRLMWAAVGDPALIPSPYEAAWMLNRITDVEWKPRQ